MNNDLTVLLPIWTTDSQEEFNNPKQIKFYDRKLLGLFSLFKCDDAQLLFYGNYTKHDEEFKCNNLSSKKSYDVDAKILKFSDAAVIETLKLYCTPKENYRGFIGWDMYDDTIPFLWNYLTSHGVDTHDFNLFKPIQGFWNNNKSNSVDLRSLYAQGYSRHNANFYDWVAYLGYEIAPINVNGLNIENPYYPGFITNGCIEKEVISHIAKVAVAMYDIQINC